jgi:hypothetical protein
LQRRYDDLTGDFIFILVAFGTPDYPDGASYWAKASDLSPVGNRFGLYESVVETNRMKRAEFIRNLFYRIICCLLVVYPCF